MMKKFILMATLCSFLCIPWAMAQDTTSTTKEVSYGYPLEIGVKVGTNFGQLLQKTAVSTLESNGYRFGIVGGAFARINFDLGFQRFYLQPELLYSQKTGNFLLQDANQTVEFVRVYHSIDVPILFGIVLMESLNDNIFRVNVGPVLHFPIWARDRVKTQATGASYQEEAIEENNNFFALGYQAGVGFDLWKITFDLRYEGGLGFLPLSTEEYQVTSRTYAVDNFHNSFQFTVGYKF